MRRFDLSGNKVSLEKIKDWQIREAKERKRLKELAELKATTELALPVLALVLDKLVGIEDRLRERQIWDEGLEDLVKDLEDIILVAKESTIQQKKELDIG